MKKTILALMIAISLVMGCNSGSGGGFFDITPDFDINLDSMHWPSVHFIEGHISEYGTQKPIQNINLSLKKVENNGEVTITPLYASPDSLGRFFLTLSWDVGDKYFLLFNNELLIKYLPIGYVNSNSFPKLFTEGLYLNQGSDFDIELVNRSGTCDVDLLESPVWKLRKFGDVSALQEPSFTPYDITLKFNKEGTVTGYNGCNEVNGRYSLDSACGMGIQGVAFDDAACLPVYHNQARIFVNTMKMVRTYEVRGDSLTLHTMDAHVLTFRKVH